MVADDLVMVGASLNKDCIHLLYLEYSVYDTGMINNT